MSFKRKVFFRIFPTEKNDFNLVKIDETSNKIYVRRLQELGKSFIKSETNYWEFDTNGVFLNCSQEAVYNQVEEGVLKHVINGYNAIILAFGQTGSGKTFTTSGLHVTEQEFGILPRIAKDLLDLKSQEPKNMKICIQMSYIEFYNNYAVDLLRNLPNVIEACKCREVRRVKILTEQDALKCIFMGEGRKNFVENNTKYLSNVCTSVATFHIIRKNMDLTNPTKTCSRLHIVDMAGNDSCGNITQIMKNPRQIGLANVTKSQLEQFILSLKENIAKHIRVKQRTNALIYYLDGDFSYESILRFVGHIKVRTEDLVITLSMLRFGNIAQGLKMRKTVIQFENDEELELASLRNRLQNLEREKYLNSVLLNQDLVTGMNLERQTHLKNLVNDYLSDGIREITVMNVADTELVLNYIKEICHGYQSDVKKLEAENQILLAQQSQTSLKAKNSQSSGSKISRKSSKIKSKDSVLKEKRTSAVSVDTTILNDLPSVVKKRKKSVKSSTGNKHSSQSKRKSSNTSIDKRDSRSSVRSSPEILLLIPEVVPELEDTWKRFASSSTYKENVEEYKENEKDVRNNFMTYIEEIKKMHICRDNLDKCSNDLILAQTFRKFNSKDEFDENGDIVLSFAERLCKDNLEKAQAVLLEQQETVLKDQEILKVYLENRRNIIKKAEEGFDHFCLENYRIPSANLDAVKNDLNPHTFEVNLDCPDNIFEQEAEIVSLPEVSHTTQVLRHLQKLFLHERKTRKQIIKKKNNEWKNS